MKYYDNCLTAKQDIGSFQTLDYIFELKFIKDEEYSTNKNDNNYNNLNQEENETKSLKNKNTENSESYIEINKKNIRNKNTKTNLNYNKKKLINNGENKRELYLDHNSAQVENFLISFKPYQQLSDHFGLSINLRFRDITINEEI